ncbi:unnamed protein product [Cuscuta epithymum]|uniref:HAT C-terminal dimerisation domain-containing protein n=1 Tax=Cuscuta epithymum TaxID=186058 RepID=A0AAV0FIH9_9ASTE|nr:unnamed protein product [Cuscuta epithymum]
MATKMKSKYDKYWGDIEKMNKLMYMDTVLDPNSKLIGVKIALVDIYGEKDAQPLFQKIKCAYDLSEEYRRVFALPVVIDENGVTSNSRATSSTVDSSTLMNLVTDRVKQRSGSQHFSRSEFDRYLDEERGDEEEKDGLTWWKLNSLRFSVVACMARDILVIPI